MGGEGFLAALARLRATPEPTPQFGVGSQSSSESASVSSEISSKFTDCALPLASSEVRIKEMLALVERDRPRCNEIRALAESRPLLWATKLRCDEDVSNMTQGGPLNYEEWRGRYNAKHLANEAFERNTADLSSLARDVLDQHWTQTFLSEFSNGLSDSFLRDVLEPETGKPPPLETQPALEARPPLETQFVVPSFVEGEMVEFWSASKQVWSGAVVEKVFHGDCIYEGYKVISGTVKVSNAVSKKFIRPEHISASLRQIVRHDN